MQIMEKSESVYAFNALHRCYDREREREGVPSSLPSSPSNLVAVLSVRKSDSGVVVFSISFFRTF
jgi:hypothetical protein